MCNGSTSIDMGHKVGLVNETEYCTDTSRHQEEQPGTELYSVLQACGIHAHQNRGMLWH